MSKINSSISNLSPLNPTFIGPLRQLPIKQLSRALKHAFKDNCLRRGEDELNPVDNFFTMFTDGYQLDQQGDREGARQIYHKTSDLLERLFEQDQEPLRIRHLAEIALAHGVSLYYLGQYADAQPCFRRAVEIFESMMLLDASRLIVERLAHSWTWLARTQRRTNKLEFAASSYARAIPLWQSLANFSSPHLARESRRLLAACYLGYSKVLFGLKDKETANILRRQALFIFKGCYPLSIA